MLRVISPAWGIAILAYFFLQGLVCWLLYSCFKRIPGPFRQQQPGMVFVLLVPGINVIWNFKVYPLLAKSYKAYFESIGNATVGDCCYELGVVYCVCAALAMVRFTGTLAGLAAPVFVFWYMVKAWRLRSMITEDKRAGGVCQGGVE